MDGGLDLDLKYFQKDQLMPELTDPFHDKDGSSRVLAGCIVYSGSTRLAEMAGRVGFDAVWIDMEHASSGLTAAEAMCVATEAGGAVPLVRTAGVNREHVLHAFEIGGRIVVVPMVNDADTAKQIVEYGKYPPVGRRGFFKYSRGGRFGENPNWMADTNASTALMPQIETLEAVKNLDAILAVPGIDGILIGPSDLSVDFGTPGKFDAPDFQETVAKCISRARELGKHAGIVAGDDKLISLSKQAGANLLVFSADTPLLHKAWSSELKTFRAGL